jgi:Domain of unknown function (DUF5122) beta-propeller
LALQADAKILAAASSWTNNARFVPIRLFANGSFDSSFDAGLGADDQILRMLVEPNGAVIIAGIFTEFNGVPRAGIARLHNDNPVPPSFVLRSFTGNAVQLSAQPKTNVTVYAVEDQPPTNWPVRDISHGGVFDTATGKVKFGPFFDAEPRQLTYVVYPPPGTQGVFPFIGHGSADGISTLIGGAQTMVLAGPHPADLAPSDWRLTIDEVTAYAAAWRTGGTWSLEPNPIPIAYVTRAGALWRGGESYGLNPAGGDPPLWWVNTNLVKPLVLTDESVAALRRAPKGYVAGEPLEITVETIPAAGVTAYALEESFPAGWQVVSMSPGGVIDPVHSQIKWGPFFDAASRTLRYQLVPPASTTAFVTLAGTASANGRALPVTGPALLLPGSRLSWSWQPKDRTGSLQFRGALGARYLIETSTDLIRWEPWLTFTNNSGLTEIPTPSAPDSSQRFYRGKLAW